MEVTPQELRDIEIRESFRGYHREDVDELLDRAAATIEHLDHQLRVVQERLSGGGAAAAPERAPTPVGAPGAAFGSVAEGDVIQRTLLLAQRAADEAVAEAQARAQQLTGEAEAKAAAMMSEAESTARRVTESERHRIESEIAQLTSARDALTTDVEALERFSTEYRDRIRRAIEAELLHLTASSGTADLGTVRPALRSEGMVLPSASSPAPKADPPASAPVTPIAEQPVVTPAASTRQADLEPTGTGDAFREAREVPAWPAEPARRAEPAARPEPAARAEPVSLPEPEGWGDEAPREDDAWLGDATFAPPPTDEGWGSGSLDDDAFFASLRDAVRDDEALRPRDEYDEDPEENRRLFRRRR